MFSHPRFRRLILIAAPVALLGLTAFFWTRPAPIEYNADIRPIFNNNCITCHGGVKQSGGFSVLFEEEAFRPAESGKLAIIPGEPEQSELIRRVKHNDPEERMPAEHDALSPEDIAKLDQWIADGAEWQTHWAYIKPDRTIEPPHIGNDWVINGIDGFILEGIKEAGFKPAPAASKEKLIRRVSLDLIGLPPTIEEVELFVADESPDAYEKVVDRLLDSPRYGEKWASMWLDLARYGDSQGYQKDPKRIIWPYRDWLIMALNDGMTFDQFTIEQLAGDLLPNPTQEQILATAYHRNTMSNDEGGTDDEEFRVTAVLDRLNTTFEVWQGITMSCVQCHSHPYDPFKHEEYYTLYAFFNNTADTDKGHERPLLRAFSPAGNDDIEEQIVWFEKNCAVDVTRMEASQPAKSLVERYDRVIAISNDPNAQCKKAFELPNWKKRLDKLKSMKPPSTPIMEELPPDSSRTTQMFERGNWLVLGDTLLPNVPASLPALRETQAPNRLGLAQWLVDEENPLTSRVIVNRFWEQIFGTGIIETLEDFGSQGAPPSHPELLDWLAIEFQFEQEWQIKSLLKLMVMSATYRQSNVISPALQEIDPANRLLARGPRYRLSAEQIRDQALAVGGLLSEKMYGPSVMPPQPEGTWQVIRNVLKWKADEDENRYRRGLYTFWRRSSPYPSMISFDTPSREFCVSRRIRTNTPLQALVVLNDPVYVEAAVGLAHRMQAEAGSDPAEQLKHGMQLALAHPPSETQKATLATFYESTLQHYLAHPDDVVSLVPDSLAQKPEMAALINSANVILNLDEFLSKP
ncbi:MAG: PSD1 and planctomycete cytochrome C domain-containing protein [Rhodothermales bacterium]